MFPPKPAETLEQGVENLQSSLSRACGNWGWVARIVDTPEGDTAVVFLLASELPKGAKKPVAAYIKGYMKHSGWKVKKVRTTKRYVEAIVSNT